MALIASYIQKDIPNHYIHLGEIDLLRKVREIPEQIIMDLWEELNNNGPNLKKPVRIFCPKESATVLQEEIEGATIVACERLDDAVYMTWPEIMSTERVKRWV